MTGGQTDLSLEQIEIKKSNENENGHETNKKITKEIIIEPTKTELSKHQLLLESIQEKSGGKCIWIENEID